MPRALRRVGQAPGSTRAKRERPRLLEALLQRYSPPTMIGRRAANCQPAVVEGRAEGRGGPPARGVSVRGSAERECAMCGALPSAARAKLKACGGCMSVYYCSPACQRQHWGEGGHKQACLQLREVREVRKRRAVPLGDEGLSGPWSWVVAQWLSFFFVKSI